MRLAVLATVADLGTFLVMLSILGPAAERNPLAARAILVGALEALVVAKVLIVAVLILWQRTGWRYGRPVWLTGLVVGIVGLASNLRAVAG